jgi:hypothetical protein
MTPQNVKTASFAVVYTIILKLFEARLIPLPYAMALDMLMLGIVFFYIPPRDSRSVRGYGLVLVILAAVAFGVGFLLQRL